MKRVLPLLLILLLIAGCFTGCGVIQEFVGAFTESGLASTAPDDAATADTSVVTTAPTEITEDTSPVETTAPTTAPAEQVNTDLLLLSVLSGNAPVIGANGQARPLSSYLISLDNTSVHAYTLIDFDRDGQNEMVLETYSPTSSYIVLHCSGTDVFAFVFGPRELGGLTADGSFMGSSSAFDASYCTLRFNGGGCIVTCEARGDDSTNYYEINGVSCSEQSYRNFVTEWNKKSRAVWIRLDADTEETVPPQSADNGSVSERSQTPYLQSISRADQGIYEGPGYNYSFACIIGIAGTYTIVEEQWDSEGNLWGRLKSGAGWVNLTDIRSGSASMPLLTANYADSALLNSGNYYHCILDTSEYMVQIAFRASATLNNVTFYSMSYANELEIDAALYSLAQLTSGKPLVVDVAFPGDMTTYGIRFTDSSGIVHYYSIYISGMDGSLVMTPFNP